MDTRSYGIEEPLDSIAKGALVRVCLSNWGSPPTYCMGVVIETATKNNQTLFPSVMVYNLETKKITREFLGGLKVISKVD
jgi:hypothetical protein